MGPKADILSLSVQFNSSAIPVYLYVASAVYGDRTGMIGFTRVLFDKIISCLETVTAIDHRQVNDDV